MSGPARHAATLALVALLPLALGSLCEGEGRNRPGAITQAAIDPRCTPVGGPFPSGFDLAPGPDAVGLVMRFNPAGLLRFDLSTAPPTPANAGPVPTLASQAAIPPSPQVAPGACPVPTPPRDTDGDGIDDALAFRDAGLCPSFNPCCLTWPKVGGLDAVDEALVLVTASDYEEVMFLAPDTSALTFVEVTNPTPGAADRPLYPPAGTSALRTAVSTMTCVYPPVAVDSEGRGIAPSPQCDATRAGFLTRFTAATALAAGRLFVATSNLASSARGTFNPGTVLVHAVEQDVDGRITRIRPDPNVPVLFTTAFNPTALTPHRTASGREVVLVTSTGAITAGGALLTDSGVDVIDAASARLVAHVPLGRAGAAFTRLAIDPGGHVALLGAESSRSLYAIDLSALDDPALYAPGAGVVMLDGTTPGFPDARVFDATAPLTLPTRPGGPSPAICPPRTNVTLNHDGRLAFATDWCDGTVSVVAIDWTLPLERPLSPTRFSSVRRLDLFAPKTPANFGLPAAPSLPRTRRGEPGVDYDGPDLFFLVNEPEGQLCAARVEL